MRDWRMELQQNQATPKRDKTDKGHLCSCMAGMKGKWINGTYVCIRCNKPVYDTLNK
ncbi:hypothetical protein J6TS7_29240 [Paenibacillus dendritiformis]|nr:hypothetical protein J6TS7_29240 [Paenibacillus dendritiformis]